MTFLNLLKETYTILEAGEQPPADPNADPAAAQGDPAGNAQGAPEAGAEEPEVDPEKIKEQMEAQNLAFAKGLGDMVNLIYKGTGGFEFLNQNDQLSKIGEFLINLKKITDKGSIATDPQEVANILQSTDGLVEKYKTQFTKTPEQSSKYE